MSIETQALVYQVNAVIRWASVEGVFIKMALTDAVLIGGPLPAAA